MMAQIQECPRRAAGSGQSVGGIVLTAIKLRLDLRRNDEGGRFLFRVSYAHMSIRVQRDLAF